MRIHFCRHIGSALSACSFSLAIACAALLAPNLSAAESPRERLSLDAGWKFHLGDKWPNALRLDKAGVSGGPASEKLFSDVTWRTVNLPHDWGIEVPFDQAADMNHGYKKLGPGFEETSIGWYRRTLDLPAADASKRIRLTFDGVFRDATVWVNGWLVRHHEGGYYPFSEDITDVVKFGERNVIAVRVDATKFEGWFYEGAGIYRHVWLEKTSPVAVAPEGIFVYSKFKDNVPTGDAEIHVEASLVNKRPNDAAAVVTCEIISPEGKSIARFEKPEKLPAESQGTVNLDAKVSTPVLWSPESPELHKLVTTVAVEGKTVDRKETLFGIRTIGFDKDKGFMLNGKPYRILGTCNHQDHAGVGAAIPDALHEFRINQLKKFGSNAIRTSHNPPTPELLEACDRLGMLIMDENRLFGSDSENLGKWENLIRRDRNHPSIFLWGIANEEGAVQSSQEAGKVARTMQNLLKRLDATRPVTYAAAEGDSFWGINGVIEVRGWNYHPGPDMDTYHAKHPEQPHIGTEQASATSTRGIYESNRERGHVAAYDEAPNQWVTNSETWWSWFADRPWLSGGFVWTGFDYRGEPTPFGWPCINSHFGILDTCGFPKDNFYYYKSWWTNEVVLHLLPHWNWPGREGQEFRVDAMSNCKAVELFLNGTSLGKKEMKPNSKLTWKVKYEPGTLSAKGFDATGKVIAETKVETTGPATQLRLTPDRSTINADGADVAVFSVTALDAKGRVVPVAQDKLQFALEGAGKIIGVGNGDPSCHEPDTYVSKVPVREIDLNEWRWKEAKIAGDSPVPECANDFDDSSWNVLKAGSGDPLTLNSSNATGVFRAHLSVTPDDLTGPGVQVHFSGCDDEGWFFVNGQLAGEVHDWTVKPTFDIKKHLRPGDNVIAVCVKNAGGRGGMYPSTNVGIIGNPEPVAWSRSLFNGYAQVIVQASREAGAFKLSASANGLKSTTAIVKTQPSAP